MYIPGGSIMLTVKDVEAMDFGVDVVDGEVFYNIEQLSDEQILIHDKLFDSVLFRDGWLVDDFLDSLREAICIADWFDSDERVVLDVLIAIRDEAVGLF